ncbi:MAG: peptide deformylase [Candidatus Komeilibacteria bacterium]|nr:peptide deformylase [Candidatus Komeilibacteria bacterium]
MLEIVKYPSKILRTRSTRVTDIKSAEVQSFIAELKETMLAADGLGLAANQVNKDWQILTVSHKDGPKVFINPVICWKSFKKNNMEEGCLSFPQVFGLVRRSKKAWVIYRDENARLRFIKADGLLARVLQHEIDHIRGVLFTDKIFKYTKGEKQVQEWIKQAKDDER